MYGTASWEIWYECLEELASKCGESVVDKDAWKEEFDAGKTYEEAFYEEYPEHKA